MISLLAQSQIPPTHFGVIDWIIVAVYLAGSVAIGVYANRYVSRLSDFLVAGRSIRTYLGIATMTGTEIGLVTLMYQGGDGFQKGLSALHLGVVWGFGALFIGMTGIVIYRLREMGVMTIPEYYGRRFNVPVRFLGGLILALAGILNMGLFLRAGADFILAVTGMQSEAGLAVIMTTLMALVLIYTMLGGMVSIVITDLVQFILLGLGMIVVTVFLISNIGWSEIFRIAVEERGPTGVNPFYSDPSGESSGYGALYVVSMVLAAVSAAALWQSGTLRALSAKSPKVAKQIYSWSSITFMARFVIPAFWGVCAIAFLQQHPEIAQFVDTGENVAQEAPTLYKPIQAMPLMIGHVIPTIFLGVIVAAMMAAFMSTHDSYFLSWASVLTQDVVGTVFPDVSDRGRIWLTRIFVLLQAIFLLYWGLWFPAPDNLWDYMATTGTVYLSGASAVVVLGLYWKRASAAGAIVAIPCGLLALFPVFKQFEWHQQLCASESIPWITSRLDDGDFIRVATFVVCWSAMIIVSLLLPGRRPEEAAS